MRCICQKSGRIKILSALLAVVLMLSIAVSARAADTTQPRVFTTSEELTDYMLQQFKDREQYVNVTIPNTLPEANIGHMDLFRHVLDNDNGFIRWGYKGGTAKIIKRAGYTTFEYRISYLTTKEDDDYARRLASVIVNQWGVEDMTDRYKVHRLRAYVSANWRYDETLENNTAYSMLTNRSGTCLGLATACQLLLDSMGIPSQTVHGRFAGVDSSHILLLVKLGNWWCTFDPSELARDIPLEASYLQQNYRKLFTPEAEYLTEAFRSAHPMNPGDLIGS